MIKQLLSAAALAAMALSVNAAEVTLWEGECNFGTAWASDASFAIGASDLNVLGNETAVLKLYYTLDSACEYWQFKPCSNGEGWTPLAVAAELGNDYSCITVNAGTTSYELPLGAADIATIKANGLRMQGYGMTMTKVTTDTDKEIDPNVLWEGEYTITGWNNGAEFAAGKVKAGDILTYTFTEAGNDDAQVLVKGSDWNNLLGTTKITHKDMATGAVTVGVTQEMIDNCGGKIFLQGEGDCVCTKISKTGEFDAKGVAAYGARIPGVSVFAVIPEGTAKVAVDFDAVPEWAQLCDKSWTDKEFPKETSNDGKTVTYTITPEFVTAVATDKEFIINGGGANVVKVYYPSETESGIAGIAAEKKIVNVYDLAGRVVRHNIDSANAVNGLAKGIYIINGKKVLVK
jgi:hypothetical protein